MVHIGVSWLYVAHSSILIGYFHQAQTAISLLSLLSRHCVLSWIMTMLIMANMDSMWQVNNNLTDLICRSHNLYLVQNIPAFWDKTQGLCSFQHFKSIFRVIIISSMGYHTNNRGRGGGDLSSLDHHCLCMSLSLGPSVKAPLRAVGYLSLWSPYLLIVSLLLMILKPLFSLKRVWPVPRREQ